MSSYKPTNEELQGLVGNPDVYAVQHKDGAWTPVREKLTPGVIRRHMRGDITVGTYVVNPPDQARTLVLDLDAETDEVQDKMLTRVLDVIHALQKTEKQLTYGVEFSGRKGYHVWVVADDYMEAATLYRLGRGIREEAGYPAMEVFPKQTEVRDLGNLVKLPGGFHAVTGKANDFITQGHSEGVRVPTPTEVLTSLAALYPEVHGRARRDGEESIEYPCVANIQAGVEQGGRNIHLFHLATMLRKFSIADDNVTTIIERANEASGDPLLPDEIEGILDNSRFSGPVCDQLSDDVSCGEQCIKARHPGLFTRAGALAHAPVGEEVVVTVGERGDDDLTVELEHPDMVQGRAILHEPKQKRKHRDV